MIKCPICESEVLGIDNAKVSDEELLKRYTPYPFICEHCTTVFNVFHDDKVVFVKEIISAGNKKTMC